MRAAADYIWAALNPGLITFLTNLPQALLGRKIHD
jgi:hypothetical protein